VKLDQQTLAEWVKKGEEEEKRDDKKHKEWVEVGNRVKRLRSSWVRYRRALLETGSSSLPTHFPLRNALH
jgi:hypothetical protein